jgi:pimeloyl-ACP methyl ester carboxylesterase
MPGLAPAQPFYVAPVDLGLEPYASTADTVKLVDGRNLHFVCLGKGSPTVILTAGLGDWVGAAWEHFQPEVAKITRVCSWDRPGYGLSDGTAAHETVATNAADLEAGLERGRIAGPYLMVGHSLGAFETLLFADHNRAKVMGMVLIDPSFPDQDARAKEIVDQFHLPPTPPRPNIALWRKCADDVRSGALKAGGPDPDKCVAFPSSFPRVVRAALTAQYTGSALQFETASTFDADVPAQSKIVINPTRNYGDMPLVVLTSTLPAPGAPPLDPAVLEASNAMRAKAHEALATLSARGTHVTVPDSTHYIHRTQPQAVLDAIQSVIVQARGNPMR